jgi:hypothetical protein
VSQRNIFEGKCEKKRKKRRRSQMKEKSNQKVTYTEE